MWLFPSLTRTFTMWNIFVGGVYCCGGCTSGSCKTQPVEFAEEKSYNTIVMDTSSDILRITTNPKTSSIVTTLLDHRVLYWTRRAILNH